MTKNDKINKLDLKILETLQTNARITNQQLAEQVHLSASACLSRVKRMEKSGLLKRYITELDLEQFAPHVAAFAEVTLKSHFPQDFSLFDKTISTIEEVTESYKISGSYDYLLKFVCTDIKRYNKISDALIESDLGIAKLNTLIILEQTKNFSGLPLQSLFSP